VKAKLLNRRGSLWSYAVLPNLSTKEQLLESSNNIWAKSEVRETEVWILRIALPYSKLGATYYASFVRFKLFLTYVIIGTSLSCRRRP